MEKIATSYGGTITQYDESEGDFVDNHVAEVVVEDSADVNEVGKVVDLLNDYSGDEVREMVLDE